MHMYMHQQMFWFPYRYKILWNSDFIVNYTYNLYNGALKNNLFWIKVSCSLIFCLILNTYNNEQ